MTDLVQVAARIADCKACVLSETRTNTVPGEGDAHAKLMLIGEGPGAQEDEQGRPFVGRAGQLLEQMLDAIGLSREQVYITNIVKCRPPGNRNPEPTEAQACEAFLRRQIELIDPTVILLLGSVALRFYLDSRLRITQARGQWYEKEGRDVLATFHPAYLLRDGRQKVLAFDDLLLVKQRLIEEEKR